MQLQAEKAPSQDAETPVEGQAGAYQRGEQNLQDVELVASLGFPSFFTGRCSLIGD